MLRNYTKEKEEVRDFYSSLYQNQSLEKAKRLQDKYSKLDPYNEYEYGIITTRHIY